MSTKITQNPIPNETNTNVDVINFDAVKHALDFYNLYPEFVKDSNIAVIPFKTYYPGMVKAVERDELIIYTIVEKISQNVIGFILFERIFPFIASAHIVIYQKYRNFYNAYNAGLLLKDKISQHNIRQVVAYVVKENMNARLLLKKLGFYLWGKNETCMAYSLILPKRKG